MEKLELKHLVPYLPYGLKVIMEGKKTNVAWMSNKNIVVIRPNNYGEYKKIKWQYAHMNVKPILRPLSDLTKEIEVNGEKFIPLVELGKISYPKVARDFDLKIKDNYIDLGAGYTFHFYNNSDGIFFSCKRGYKGKTWNYDCAVTNQLELFQKLFEWHIDLFELIPNDLAIDINTI